MSMFGNNNKNYIYESLVNDLRECPITLEELFDVLSTIAKYYSELLKTDTNK